MLHIFLRQLLSLTATIPNSTYTMCCGFAVEVEQYVVKKRGKCYVGNATRPAGVVCVCVSKRLNIS